MGWWGEQSYQLRCNAEQAAAITLMAESYWMGQRSDTDLRDTPQPNSRLFNGKYPTIQSGRAGESPLIERTQQLVGITFPWHYCCEMAYCPLSFTFVYDTESTDRLTPWLLVTAIPLSKGVKSGTWTDDPAMRPYDSWVSMPDELLNKNGGWPVSPDITTTAYWITSGCQVHLRKQHPVDLTAFLYFANGQLGLRALTDPDVDEFVKEQFLPDWEASFDVQRCLSAAPGRVEYWRHAFGC